MPLLWTKSLWSQETVCIWFLQSSSQITEDSDLGFTDSAAYEARMAHDYLIDFSSIVVNSAVPTITQKVNTPYGDIVFRTKDLKEMAALVENYGRSEDGMALFVNGLFNRRQIPQFVNSEFLSWVLSSYDHTLRFNYVDYSDPRSGYTPTVFTKGNPDFIQRAGIAQDQNKVRKEIKIAPIRFYTYFEDFGSPTDWLYEFEATWIFKILIREPIVRKIVAPFSSLKSLSSAELNDVIFMISAYPELLRLAGKLDRIGFKPGHYFLTDGHMTESDRVKFGKDLWSKLVIAKDFSEGLETSYAFISIDGDPFYEMSFDNNENFNNHIKKVWREFKDRHKNLFKHALTEINIELDQDFRIELDPDEPNSTEIMALFYIQLLDQLQSLKFSN
jgi:hypothetical protein